jgi:hypothetical protein
MALLFAFGKNQKDERCPGLVMALVCRDMALD